MKNLLKNLAVAVLCSMLLPGVTLAKNDKSDEHTQNLPPGLAKKQESGKSLPPGWQKKLNKGETLDEEIYDQGEVVSRDEGNGTVVIKVADQTIQLIEKTREIVDILGY